MGSWIGRGDLVVLEKDAQMLYGALGVLTELRDIAAERLRPPVKQPMKGIKQNALQVAQRILFYPFHALFHGWSQSFLCDISQFRVASELAVKHLRLLLKHN